MDQLVNQFTNQFMRFPEAIENLKMFTSSIKIQSHLKADFVYVKDETDITSNLVCTGELCRYGTKLIKLVVTGNKCVLSHMEVTCNQMERHVDLEFQINATASFPIVFNLADTIRNVRVFCSQNTCIPKTLKFNNVIEFQDFIISREDNEKTPEVIFDNKPRRVEMYVREDLSNVKIERPERSLSFQTELKELTDKEDGKQQKRKRVRSSKSSRSKSKSNEVPTKRQRTLYTYVSQDAKKNEVNEINQLRQSNDMKSNVNQKHLERVKRQYKSIEPLNVPVVKLFFDEETDESYVSERCLNTTFDKIFNVCEEDEKLNEFEDFVFNLDNWNSPLLSFLEWQIETDLRELEEMNNF